MLVLSRKPKETIINDATSAPCRPEPSSDPHLPGSTLA